MVDRKSYKVYLKDVRNFAGWHSADQVRRIVDNQNGPIYIQGEYIASKSNKNEIALAQAGDTMDDGKSNIMTIPVSAIDRCVEQNDGYEYKPQDGMYVKPKKTWKRTAVDAFLVAGLPIILLSTLFMFGLLQKHTAGVHNAVAEEIHVLYVRGQYGKKCYTEEQAHGNITRPIYFDTLGECLESLLR